MLVPLTKAAIHNAGRKRVLGTLMQMKERSNCFFEFPKSSIRDTSSRL